MKNVGIGIAAFLCLVLTAGCGNDAGSTTKSSPDEVKAFKGGGTPTERDKQVTAEAMKRAADWAKTHPGGGAPVTGK